MHVGDIHFTDVYSGLRWLVAGIQRRAIGRLSCRRWRPHRCDGAEVNVADQAGISRRDVRRVANQVNDRKLSTFESTIRSFDDRYRQRSVKSFQSESNTK